MNEERLDEFDSIHVVGIFGEIGSRGMQRIMVVQTTLQSGSGERRTVDLVVNDWVDVQEGRYRYHAIDYGDAVRIKLVIGEYLACEVIWSL
jgi:hypothetical protein